MIALTPEAVAQIQKIQNETNQQGYGLVVSVVGGGCSGMSYKLDFAPEPRPEDKAFEQDGVRIFVDSKSFLFVKGLTLHYSGGLNGTGFNFNNPNASRSCGCGSSFAV